MYNIREKIKDNKFIFQPKIISYVMWSTFANKVLTFTPDFLKLC